MNLEDETQQNAQSGVNQFTVTARLISKSVLRYTPAGLPVCEFELEHDSVQLEATKPRQVRCELQALAMGAAAHQVDGLDVGRVLDWQGFIALRSHKSKSLRFHVCAMRPVSEA